MTILTDRDLERVANLRMNWRKEFLREVVRLRHERDIAPNRDRPPSAETADRHLPGASPWPWPWAGSHRN